MPNGKRHSYGVLFHRVITAAGRLDAYKACLIGIWWHRWACRSGL